MDSELDTLLLEHPFFQGMDPEACSRLSKCAQKNVYDAGEYIIREGEVADRFFLVRHGRVAIELHSPGKAPMVIATIDGGEMFGWSWVSPPYKWSFSARAVQLTRLLSLDAKCIVALMEDDKTLGYDFYKRLMPVISERLSATRIQLTNIYGGPGQ